MIAVLVSACTDQWHGIAAKTDPRIVGDWKSESLTRLGTTTAKFRGDGTCYFRESGGERLSCNWSGPGNGQTRIAVTFPGKSDVSFAIIAGDRLFVNEPGRETLFIRQ